MEPGKAHGDLIFHTFHTFHTYLLYTRGRVCAYARVCVCVFINFSMEGMEVWKSGLNTGLQLSIPVPYLNIGMEGGFYG